MGFEARYHRFSHVRSVGLLSERLYGPLQVKHVAYLMTAVIAGWRGLALRSWGLSALALALVFVGLLSALAGVKTMSFEARVLATLQSLLDSLLGKALEKKSARKAVLGERPALKNAPAKNELRKALRAVTPTLSVTIPAATLATFLVLQSSVDEYLKTILSALVIAAVAVPHVLGVLG